MASLYPVMLFQRSASCSETVKGMAAATAVATLARKEIAELWPRGWTAFVKRMMYVRVVGSIHSEVPVKPVWPNEPTGSNSPRFDENGESISQPSPRSAVAAGGCWEVVIFSMESCDRIEWPSRRACANLARSSAVEK